MNPTHEWRLVVFLHLPHTRGSGTELIVCTSSAMAESVLTGSLRERKYFCASLPIADGFTIKHFTAVSVISAV